MCEPFTKDYLRLITGTESVQRLGGTYTPQQSLQKFLSFFEYDARKFFLLKSEEFLQALLLYWHKGESLSILGAIARAGGGGQNQFHYSRKFVGSQILHIKILRKKGPEWSAPLGPVEPFS